MTKTNMCIIRGIGAILAAGIVIGFVCGKMMRSSRKLHKKGNKAMHAVGHLIDNVHYMFK